MDDQVTPFRIAVPEAELEDLRDRLARTRWPEKETVDDWSQGMPLADVRELCRYWAEEYDWRAREARLGATTAGGRPGGGGEARARSLLATRLATRGGRAAGPGPATECRISAQN